MAYEGTDVTVSKSQEGIRKLILSKKGSRIAFISEPPREDFQAVVQIDGQEYAIRIFGECKQPPEMKHRTYKGRVSSVKPTSSTFRDAWMDKEERRIWRVLYYHLKSIFEASDSGVMEFRELILPFVITSDGKTVAEKILPHLNKALTSNPMRMLSSGTES